MSYSYRIEPIDPWNKLYYKYKPYVLARVQDLTLEEKEDLLQSLWIKLTNAKKSYNPNKGTNPATWFFNYLKMYVSRLRNRIYKKRLKETSLDEYDLTNDETYLKLAVKDKIEAEINNRQSNNIIQRLINLLPTNYRDLLFIYYGINTTRKNQYEIARDLGVSQTAVFKMLGRAEKALKKKIERYGIGEYLDYEA